MRILPHHSLRRQFVLIAGLMLAAIPADWGAEVNPAPHPDLTELSLEQLLQVKVTSVSKRPEAQFAAAAAIEVINQEDLQRFGATTIADALRTVPGLEVASINAHSWAISARGFNGELATKLLVLMDGRSVYTPLFSGVYWDVQDTALEDIDRIEVVRGPGGALWGANAVNGVINIITKTAKDTQGLLVSGGGGSEEQGFGTVRYGGKLGENVYYRVYTKFNNRDDSVLANGQSAGDAWWMSRGGFRIDWDEPNGNWLTLQGDAYTGREHQTYMLTTTNPPTFAQNGNFNNRVAGGNVLGRWTHTYSDAADFKLQLYYDRTERESALPSEKRDTFDVDFQNRFPLCARQDIVWGVGYRLTGDRIENGYTVGFLPDHRSWKIFNTFLQDEITLVEDRLRLVLGSKFEHNDFNGWEFQPTARLAWTPTARQTFWGAVSRAVRTASRAEEDVRINTLVASGVVGSILGDPSGETENLLAYELGYRVLPCERVSLDAAVFYNVYDDLRGLMLTSPFPPTAVSANLLKGETYGAELAANWQVTDGWRLRASYTFLQIALHGENGQDPATESFFEGNSPPHQFSIRSSWDLTKQVQFDTTLRYVAALHNPDIPHYFALDLRLAWQATRNLELALVGQNLLDDHHPEFGSSVIPSPQAEVEQSILAKVTWRF